MGHFRIRKRLLLLVCLGVVFWGPSETACSSSGHSGSAQAMEIDALEQTNEQVQQGMRHYEAGEYQKAIEIWEPLLESFHQENAIKRESALSFLISYAYIALGDPENYQAYYDRAVELNPDAVQPFTVENLPSGPEIDEDQTSEDALQTYIEGWKEILRRFRLAGDTDGEIDALASLGTTYYHQKEFETGIRYHQQALVVARQSQNQSVEGEALFQVGHGYFQISDYSLALEHYTTALGIFRKIQDLDQESQVLISLGVVHSKLNQSGKALDFHQQALEAANAANRSDVKLSALIYSGQIYIDLKQCVSAVRSLNEALTLAQEIRDPASERIILNQLDEPTCKAGVSEFPADAPQVFDSPQAEAEALINQGQDLYEAGQIQAAIETWKSALVLHQELNNCVAEAQTYGLLGNAFLESDQYEEAISHQQLAVSKSRQSNNQQSLLSALGNLGNVFFALSQHERAVEYYEEALAIARRIEDSEGEANSIGHLGASYLIMGHYDKALPLHDQYLQMAQELGNHNLEAHAQLNLGSLYQTTGRPWDAIDAYQAALDIAHAINHQALVVQAYGDIANSYYSSGLYTMNKSIQYYQLQFEAAHRINNIYAQGSALGGAGLNYWQRYKIFGNSDDLNESERFLREAIALWDKLRPETLKPENRLSLLDSQLNPYLALQQVLIAKEKAGAALEIAEQSRTQVLREELLRHVSDQQQTKWSQAPELLEIQEIAAAQNATLVEYSYSVFTNELMIWVVQPDGTVNVRSHNEFLLANVLSEAGQTVSQLSATRGAGDTRGDQQSISNADVNAQLTELHRILIDPIADLLPDSEQDRVIFIPFGLLFQVPFAALRDSSGQYLIESHTIAIAPSIQSLAFTQEHRQRLGDEPGTALLVGNPSLSKELAQKYDLPSLGGAEAEVQAIAKHLKVSSENVLIGHQGAETIVKERLHTARIIHLATHGLLLESPRYRTVPGLLALAPSAQDDGALEASEIIQLTQNQPLNAELVVLSACRTGQGDITSDGIYGLTRAFLTAGVPSIVVSLWDVSDSATKLLMTRFYQELSTGKDKDQALREAILATKLEYPKVENWAAFMLIGEAK